MPLFFGMMGFHDFDEDHRSHPGHLQRHPMFGREHPHYNNTIHTPNGLESIWLLCVAIGGLCVCLPITMSILISCHYRRPTILLIFNMALIDTVMCFVYIPIYMIYVLMNPTTMPTFWFCVHGQSLFRTALGTKLTSNAIFSVKLFQNVQYGRCSKTSVLPMLRMLLCILCTWLFYFTVYHASVLHSSLSIISEEFTDGVCENITSSYSNGDDYSLHLAVTVNVIQLVEFVVTCSMLSAIFFSISKTSHQNYGSSSSGSTETVKTIDVTTPTATPILTSTPETPTPAAIIAAPTLTLTPTTLAATLTLTTSTKPTDLAVPTPPTPALLTPTPPTPTLLTPKPLAHVPTTCTTNKGESTGLNRHQYIKAGRSTAVLLCIFICSWVPLLTVDMLHTLDYSVPKGAIHLALHMCFLNPLVNSICMMHAIRSLRSDIGKCCGRMCCLKPREQKVNKYGSAESDSYMDNNTKGAPVTEGLEI